MLASLMPLRVASFGSLPALTRNSLSVVNRSGAAVLDSSWIPRKKNAILLPRQQSVGTAGSRESVLVSENGLILPFKRSLQAQRRFTSVCPATSFTLLPLSVRPFQLTHQSCHQGPHNEGVIHQCPHYCDVSYHMASTLRHHISRAHAEKNLSCPQCDYRCSTKSGLYFHKYKVHERRHVCTLCDQAFAFIGHLNMHMSRVHSDARPFACETCNLCFKTQQDLTQHENQHRPYLAVCKYCGKNFQRATDFKMHLSYHRNKTDFHCVTCDSPASLK